VRFSAVIPAFNAEKFIARSIESVLKQSLKPFEIIVVDDGSRDRTFEIVSEFKDAVTCIRQPNMGPSKARNRGVEEASGDFVAFLDADDEWLADHLQKAAAVLSAHDFLHWYCCAFERRDERGQKLFTRKFKGVVLDDTYIEDFFQAEADSNLSNTITMVIRRDLLLELGGFDETLRFSEDRTLWFRIALVHPRLGYSRQTGAVYWSHRASITQQEANKTAKKGLATIRRWRDLAVNAGPEGLRMSEPLLLKDVRTVALRSIKEKDLEVLQALRSSYGDRLNILYRFLLVLGPYIPKSVIGIALRLKSTLKPY